jgi:hypothetical protein
MYQLTFGLHTAYLVYVLLIWSTYCLFGLHMYEVDQRVRAFGGMSLFQVEEEEEGT